MARRGRRKDTIIYRSLVVEVLPDNVDLDLIIRLVDNIHYNDKGCWVRGNDSTKYQRLQVNKKTHAAHKLSYEIFRGYKFPYNLIACHECDVPACINPWHVFPGTPSLNVEDARIKRRMFSPAVGNYKKEVIIAARLDAIQDYYRNVEESSTEVRAKAQEMVQSLKNRMK